MLKTSKPGKHQSPLVLKAFARKEQICPIKVLKEYIKRTKSIRGQDQQPHRGVKLTQYPGGLNKYCSEQAGIDNYTRHSTRAASSSAAKRSNVDLATILQATGWSNATTFNKFYNKPVQVKNNFCRFSSTELLDVEM